LKDFEATQVNLSSSEGDMGILADHVPTIAQLNPGVLEVISSDKSRKFFGVYSSALPDICRFDGGRVLGGSVAVSSCWKND
jgi:hypothetical protein